MTAAHSDSVAFDSLGLPESQHTMLWDYLERAAYFMVNSES